MSSGRMKKKGLVTNVVEVVVDLDTVLRKTSGKSIAQHLSELWKSHGEAYVRNLIADDEEAGAPGVSPTLEEDYAFLGLAPSCTDEVLRAAYIARIKECHPDVGGDDAMARRVIAANTRIDAARNAERG